MHRCCARVCAWYVFIISIPILLVALSNEWTLGKAKCSTHQAQVAGLAALRWPEGGLTIHGTF